MAGGSALIVGASRGLGFAIVAELLGRGWDVTATRREGRGDRLGELAGKAGPALEVESVDTTDADSVSRLGARLGTKTFDVLFVSAGVANAGGMAESIAETPAAEFNRLMVTNAFAPVRVIEALAARVRPGGVLGAMSSGQGSLAGNVAGGNDAYRASKAALNMLMKCSAARWGRERALLLLAPGWIRTDMGGERAAFTLEETVPDIVSTILKLRDRPGLRYLDRFGADVMW